MNLSSLIRNECSQISSGNAGTLKFSDLITPFNLNIETQKQMQIENSKTASYEGCLITNGTFLNSQRMETDIPFSKLIHHSQQKTKFTTEFWNLIHKELSIEKESKELQDKSAHIKSMIKKFNETNIEELKSKFNISNTCNSRNGSNLSTMDNSYVNSKTKQYAEDVSRSQHQYGGRTPHFSCQISDYPEVYDEILESFPELKTEEMKLIIPKQRANDENYKLLKIKGVRQSNYQKGCPSAKKINNQTEQFIPRVTPLGIVKNKRFVSERKIFKSVVEYGKTSFPIIQDSTIGFTRYWQAALIHNEAEEDNDISSDAEQIKQATIKITLDLSMMKYDLNKALKDNLRGMHSFRSSKGCCILFSN